MVTQLGSDHDQIRDLIARYAHAADDGRGKDYALLFTPDGVMETAGRTLGGHEALEALIEGIYAYGIKHYQMNTAIQIDGDRATAQTDLLAMVPDEASAWQVMGCGRYEDTIVRHEGMWLFARRNCVWHRSTPADTLAAMAAFLAG